MGNKNNNHTLYDVGQIQKRIYDEDNDALRVNIIDGLQNLKPFKVLGTEIKVIHVPVIVKEVEKVEMPTIIEKVVQKDIPIWMRVWLVAQSLIVTILLLKLRNY
jgi:hypothetical protein